MRNLKTRLVCSIVASKELTGVEEDLTKLIEELNADTLKRGAPSDKRDEGATIVNWSINGRLLNLEIESGRYVRAPSALLRVRKAVIKLFGRHRIGIRGVSINELSYKIEIEGVKEIPPRISEIPKISSIRVENGQLVVLLKDISISDIEGGVPDRVLNLIEERLEKIETKPVQVIPILRQSGPKPIKFLEDPSKVALKLGWVKEFPGRGQWIYTPPYAALIEVIEDILINNIVRKLNFQPFFLPKLIPFTVMKMMPGYLDHIPEGMFYVCPPPRESSAFDKFKDKLRVTKEVPQDELKHILKAPEYVLAPAQCEPFWYFFSHEILNVDNLPIKMYDRAGWTYRWEGGGVEGLVRLTEFRRIELVYYGRPDDVVSIRDQVLEENIRVADKILDLEWRVVPGIPFFMKEGIGTIDTRDSRNVAAYDLEAYLPYRGSRDKAEWLEITACFVHKTKFIESFKIREMKNREIWSGCTGIGVSRWVAAFLAQHGFNKDDWPAPVRQKYEVYNVKIPRTITWPKEEQYAQKRENQG